MTETEKTQSFWTTLPGLLTALAALLTAITGLLVIFYPHGPAGKGSPDAPVSVTAETAKTPLPADNAPHLSTTPQNHNPTVLVVDKDGTATNLFLKGFKNSMTDDAITLKSGQSIPFDKIVSIDFLGVQDYERELKVTLTDGRVLEGEIPSGQQFAGQTDIGPFSVSVSNLKRVVFQR